MNNSVLTDHDGRSRIEAIEFCLWIRNIRLFYIKSVTIESRDVELKFTDISRDISRDVKLNRHDDRLSDIALLLRQCHLKIQLVGRAGLDDVYGHRICLILFSLDLDCQRWKPDPPGLTRGQVIGHDHRDPLGSFAVYYI